MDRIDNLHDDLRDAVLELAWRQWTAAGVAGLHESGASVIDPEALLLSSLSVARHDARLFDEILDWITRNSTLLDLARLRRLSMRATPVERRLLQAVAKATMDHSGARNLVRLFDDQCVTEEKQADSRLQPLFHSQYDARGDWAGNDEVFASAGFLRQPVVFRRLSGRPHWSNPACLRYRLRALVGMGARAEVLAYLLTHDWTHGRLIAERTAYAQASVASYLAALYDAGLVKRREEGKKTLYCLSADFREAFGELPQFVDWVRVWPVLAALVEAFRSIETTEDARWVRVADALAQGDSALRAEGFGVEYPELRGWARKGAEVLTAAVDRVITRVKELASEEVRGG
jgi:DNA-binding transcriptional ArsR family regulator